MAYIPKYFIILRWLSLDSDHSLEGICGQSEAIELQEEYNERMKQLLDSMPAQDRYQLRLADPAPDERTREVLENSL